jgi:hypothetical protein
MNPHILGDDVRSLWRIAIANRKTPHVVSYSFVHLILMG